jgi:hypothetical protein
MDISGKAYELRPVQVQYLYSSVLVEYVPINAGRPRAKKAVERAAKAAARSDLKGLTLARIDWLAEVLTGWQHRDRNGNPIKPSRAALGRQPELWIEAAAIAVGEDFQGVLKELGWQ